MGTIIESQEIDDDLEHIKALAEVVVFLAHRARVVVTIEQRSLPPLAMGNFKTMVSVRPKR